MTTKIENSSLFIREQMLKCLIRAFWDADSSNIRSSRQGGRLIAELELSSFETAFPSNLNCLPLFSRWPSKELRRVFIFIFNTNHAHLMRLIMNRQWTLASIRCIWILYDPGARASE
ncbi:uncharacterized protein [Nicotiana sylvestris]